MNKRVAIIRGSNLNSWEMQNFTPLTDEFDLIGFASHQQHFDISSIAFPVRKLFSVGQLVRARALRTPLARVLGDYHDLLGLDKALHGFDIVHSVETMYYFTYQAAKAKRKLGFKLVLTVWENIPFLQDLPATARNKEVIFEETDLYLAVSERAKEALILEGAPRDKISVQTPGIDINHFHPMEKDPELLQKFGCTKDDFIILFVAHLDREKGIFDLLYAFRMLLDTLNRTRRPKLFIGGKGKELNRVRELIVRLRIEDDVVLIGSYPYATMPKIHNLADVFVLPSIPTPSWQEQFGYVLVESMACGKPVISTLSGSITEVVGDAGLLVQPNDFCSLASALLKLLNSDKERIELGKRARSWAANRYSSQKSAEQLRSYYRNL